MPRKHGEAVPRYQEAVSWGLLALSVFVALGMAEWSKRTAASETVIDPAVMDEAVKIAPAAASNVKVNVNESLGGGLPATSNPKHATLRSESVATMQTSAGLQK